jgi:ADP-ribose pyrophosphatase
MLSKMVPRNLTDLAADIELSPSELLAKGYRDYRRYQLTLRESDAAPVKQTRDLILAGKVAAVLPIDIGRDEVVLIRQFRLPAQLANGKGDMVEIVAGRVEAGEQPLDAARRECGEEIGVAPIALVELFSYLTTPGLTDEQVTLFLAAVDAARVPERPVAPDGEQIRTLRVSIDAALAALAQGNMRNGPLLIALQWLALNRTRVAALLGLG